MTTAYRNHCCRLREFVYQGLRLISLENELLRIGVLADEGGDIIEFLHHPAFDFPFLGPTCRVDLPQGKLLLETFAGAAGTRLRAAAQLEAGESLGATLHAIVYQDIDRVGHVSSEGIVTQA